MYQALVRTFGRSRRYRRVSGTHNLKFLVPLSAGGDASVNCEDHDMSDASSEDPTSPTQCFESYRSKEVVGQSEAAKREAAAILKAASDAIARRAQNPEEIAGTRIGKAYMTAAGLPAILKSFQFGFSEMGALRTAETFTRINQRDGFDCQSCAWGNPDHRKVFEFCENGAKALADEATKKRISREFFATHSVLELAEKSDYWL